MWVERVAAFMRTAVRCSIGNSSYYTFTAGVEGTLQVSKSSTSPFRPRFVTHEDTRSVYALLVLPLVQLCPQKWKSLSSPGDFSCRLSVAFCHYVSGMLRSGRTL